MKKEKINYFFQRLEKNKPNPSTELNYYDSYTLLIAVVLSAQATDESVNKATKNLFLFAKNPKQMIDLGESKLKELVKTIGLFNSKSKNIIKLSKILLELHNGMVPKTREDLEKLPGVGRKTANVVLNVAFGIPTIAVDTHVFRVSNRTGLATGKNPLEVEKKLDKVVPENFKQQAHNLLILHGRYICKSRKPNCVNCKVNDLCYWKNKAI